MKAVTYLIASPDEIAQALVNEKTRKQWDLNLETVNKKKEGYY